MKTVLGGFVVAALVALPFVWFARLPSRADGPFTCEPGLHMAQVIDARMRDTRVHVGRVRVVEGDDDSYESLFLVSARVRAGGVFVGVGTWAANASGVGGSGQAFTASRTKQYIALVPVNELASTLTVRGGQLRLPGMSAAAKASQRCAGAP